jgi:hypothetical protein
MDSSPKLKHILIGLAPPFSIIKSTVSRLDSKSGSSAAAGASLRPLARRLPPPAAAGGKILEEKGNRHVENVAQIE